MAGITDLIEEFLKDCFKEQDNLQISRNQLAEHFSCAPSQINYVLTTRFSPSRGYIVESRRGGSGYVTIVRLSQDKNEYLNNLIEHQVGKEISQNRLRDILEKMQTEGLITTREARIIFAGLQDKVLSGQMISKDMSRAMIFKSIIKQIIVEK